MKPNQANRSSSNEKQKDFPNRIYEEGGRQRRKQTQKMLQRRRGTLQNDENERVFRLSDFLTPQQLQVASYFSRMSNLQKTLSPFSEE